MSKNKMISIGVLSLIVVAGVSFYGGVKYAQVKVKNNSGAGNSFQGRGVNRSGGMMRNSMGGFTVGEVISKDATSMTIKIQDGGSKIVFFTNTTPVAKTVTGAFDDVSVGKMVMISGKANPDGSVNAESIQLRTAPPQIEKVN